MFQGGMFQSHQSKTGLENDPMEAGMKDSAFRMTCLLLKNALRFHYLKIRGKPGIPEALSLEITHHCMGRCVMCNIWKIPRDLPVLNMEEWVDLLTSDLFRDLRELDITGGEPFLREDLVGFFSEIGKLKGRSLGSLRSVALTTNGLLPSRILDWTEKMLKGLKAAGLDLVMVCAMDGIGDVHDRVRNVPGAWLRVNETVQGLRNLRESYANLVVGLKTTVLPFNIEELPGLVQYAEANGLFGIISPCIITEGRYRNPDREMDLAFSPVQIEKMAEFYDKYESPWGYHRHALVKYFRSGVMKKPCSCGFNYFFVRSTGDILLCPLIDRSPGNLRKASVEEIFFSKESSKIRRGVGGFPECRSCTEPGLERYALPYEGLSYLGVLLKMGRGKFFEMHRHMGLDKYLE